MQYKYFLITSVLCLNACQNNTESLNMKTFFGQKNNNTSSFVSILSNDSEEKPLLETENLEESRSREQKEIDDKKRLLDNCKKEEILLAEFEKKEKKKLEEQQELIRTKIKQKQLEEEIERKREIEEEIEKTLKQKQMTDEIEREKIGKLLKHKQEEENKGQRKSSIWNKLDITTMNFYEKIDKKNKEEINKKEKEKLANKETEIIKKEVEEKKQKELIKKEAEEKECKKTIKKEELVKSEINITESTNEDKINKLIQNLKISKEDSIKLINSLAILQIDTKLTRALSNSSEIISKLPNIPANMLKTLANCSNEEILNKLNLYKKNQN